MNRTEEPLLGNEVNAAKSTSKKQINVGKFLFMKVTMNYVKCLELNSFKARLKKFYCI